MRKLVKSELCILALIVIFISFNFLEANNAKLKKIKNLSKEKQKKWRKLSDKVIGLAFSSDDKIGKTKKKSGYISNKWRMGNKYILIIDAGSEFNADIVKGKARSKGAEILSSYKNFIKIAVRKKDILKLNEINEIKKVRFPNRLYTSAIDGEEPGLIGTTNSWVRRYDGSGVKIAIIDLGFNGLGASITAQEITNNIVLTNNYTVESIDAGDFHGTAMAEVICEMAPGADLYLMKVDNEVDFGNAKEDCKLYNIDIIVSAIVNPIYIGDGTGAFCDIVNDADSSGILWVNSVGNYALKHWYGQFTDNDTNDIHEFDNSEVNPLIGTFTNGQEIEVFLTWDDSWIESTNDYDLFLYAVTNVNDDWETVFTQSSTYQLSGYSNPPLEHILYITTNTIPMSYGLSVMKDRPSKNLNMRIISIDHELTKSKADKSILSPADASGSFSVAAIGVNEWKTNKIVEPFSAQGPTMDDRNKPDISGVDNNTNSVYGRFLGTSAAAASVAGAAALVMEKYPLYNNNRIKEILTNIAIDAETPGYDYKSGHGEVSLLFLTNNTSINITKSIEEINFNSVSSPPIPGSIISYKVTCISSGWDTENVVVYDKIREYGIYITNSYTTNGGWICEWSTNSGSINQDYNSSDYTDEEPVNNVKWIRWKKPNITGGESSTMYFSVLVK